MDDDRQEFPRDRIFTGREVKSILEAAKGLTLGEVDAKHVFDKTLTNPKVTGIAGDVIEQSLLGCEPDNDQAPDLLIDGIPTELKTIGIRKKKIGKDEVWTAKEPMSVTAVSIADITGEEFLDSSFWHKLNHLLIVFYEYESDIPVKASEYSGFHIIGYSFHEFSADDREALEHDWTTVRDFIKDLKELPDPDIKYGRLSNELVHELSVIDTAPKYPNPPRFRLKRSFMDTIVQHDLSGAQEDLDGINSFAELDARCHRLSEKYAHRTIRELAYEFGTSISKSAGANIITAMFDSEHGRINSIDVFSRFGVNAKTIKLDSDGCRTEDMKLFPINFKEMTLDTLEFEDSEFFAYFSEHQLLCPIFEEQCDGKLENTLFLGFKRTAFPEEFIQKEVKRTWAEIRETVISGRLRSTIDTDRYGKPIRNRSGTLRTSINLPKSRDHDVFVRGGGTDAAHTIELVPGVIAIRQFLWVRGDTVVDLLDKQDFL